MDYNELKRALLRVVADNGSLDSARVAQTLSSLRIAELDIHAVRMALMRYYKLGLLKRARVGGSFTYALTQRGRVRLEWLERQTRKTTST